MAVSGGSSIVDFVHRFKNLQAQRDSADQLISDILLYTEKTEAALSAENNNLQKRLDDATLDLANDTESRRFLQTQVQQLTSAFESLKNANSYVAVLIDGDGLLFDQQLVMHGFEGGLKAAQALEAAILERCGAETVGVVVKIYANITTLANAMRRDGSLEYEDDLKKFTQGFTQARPLFDVIDLGRDQEQSDKIQETTKWHLKNANCRQVILGVSHDAAYASFLTDLFNKDPPNHQRVTVLEGVPCPASLIATRVNVLKLPRGLFRSDELENKRPYIPLPLPPPVSEAKSSSLGTPTPTATTTTSAASTPAIPSATTAPGAAPTYAKAIAGATSPPQPAVLQSKSLNVQVRPAPAPQQPKTELWHPGPRGLDPPIQVSQTALDTIKKRKDHNKLCNNHYLRGPCSKGDACCFEHKYKPNKDELNAIAFLTRQNPCSSGQKCNLDNCIYGHHCPSVRNGVCTQPFCKFDKEGHPPGTKMKVSKKNGSH